MSHKHKKRFGQNFLNNTHAIDQIVRAIAPLPTQHLVEIGPGEAALTEPLLKAVGKLDIIEIDNDLIAPLTKKLGHYPAFNLHHTDALEFDYAQLVENQKLRMVGNLPYNISSPLIFHLLTFADKIQDMHFMLQKEVVDRMCAEPGTKAYGRLSVMVQYHCEAQSLFILGPENFTPPPKVDSAIVRLIPRDHPYLLSSYKDFHDLVKQSFSQKRKTLRNNLKGWLSVEQIESLGLDAQARAETLSLESFTQLANLYSSTKSAN